MARPKIWLLDEPTASLDAESERQVVQAIQTRVKADDILVVATHRPALAAQLANRVVVIRQGEVAAEGSPEKLLPKVMRRRGRGAGGRARAARSRMPAGFQPRGPNSLV